MQQHRIISKSSFATGVVCYVRYLHRRCLHDRALHASGVLLRAVFAVGVIRYPRCLLLAFSTFDIFYRHQLSRTLPAMRAPMMR